MNSELISLILPTRRRPALVERFFDSLRATTSRLDKIEVILYADEDDVSSHHLNSLDFHVTRIIGPVLSMGGYNSACFAKACGEIIILVNDDVVIRSKGWDEYIREIDLKFEDKIYLAYPNDLFKKGKFCTFPIMSRRTCVLLFDPYPISYKRYFIDPHLFDIFKRLQHAGIDRILYCSDIIFEHLHYRNEKASFDATYSDAKLDRFADDSIFINLISMRSSTAKRLICEIRNQPIVTLDNTPEKNSSPRSVIAAIYFFSYIFLFDRELPYRWRIFLWYWFIGRFLLANGFFRF